MNIKCPNCFRKKWFFFALFIVVLLGLVYYNQSKKSNNSSFNTYTIVPVDLNEVVTGSGKITASQKATLRFQTGGQLAWVGVKKGDKVSKWQAIASLDQRQLEKDIQKKLSFYMTQRMDFDQTEENYEDEILDEEIKRILNKNQYALDRSVIDVEVSDLAKQYAHLYSPIDGIVIEASDEFPGVNVSALSTEYTIVNPQTLRFSAEIEELEIAKVKEGLSAIVNLDAFPNNPVNSIVSEIEFSATQNTSGNTVFIVNLPIETNNQYRLEMNGDVEIILSQKPQALAVPIEAVEEIDDKKYVKIINGVTPEQREIQTGIETDDYYEVLSGLDFGNQIALPK